jgi:hypothetical protein
MVGEVGLLRLQVELLTPRLISTSLSISLRVEKLRMETAMLIMQCTAGG